MANQRLKRSRNEIKLYMKKHRKLIGIYAIIAAFISGMLNGFTVASGRVRLGLIQSVPKNPLLLLYYGIFFEGSISNFVVFFLLIFGIVFYLKVVLDKKDANLDERNFTISKSGVYGTSHEISDEEREIILHADINPENMTNSILGRDRQTGECLEVRPDLPPQLQLGPHKFVAGTTGKRKSRSQVIPDILQMIKRGESGVCTDPKGELYEMLSVLAREEGYIVKVFNLVNTINSDSCAFLKLVGKNTMMAQTMAEVLVANSSDGSTQSSIWQKGEKALIAFGILAVAMDKNIPDEEKTLYAVYDFLVNQSIEEIEDKAENMPITNPAKKQWNIFKTSPEKVRDGIRTNLATDLQLMMEPSIQAITSYDEIDLELPGKQKCLYFVIMSDQEDTLNYFSAIFFSFMFIKLVKYADRRPSKKCRIPVNLVMEEFPNIGKIPGFPKKLNTIRSRDIRVTIIVQDMGQLMDMYEGHIWESIVGACDIQILLGLNDTNTNAEWWSKRSGTLTVEVDSTKHQKNLLQPINLQTMEQETEGKGKRQLMMADEIASMPVDQSLVFLSGYHMLKVKKFDYTEHPYVQRLTPMNATLHEPEWWVKVKDEEWFQEQLAELEAEREAIEAEEKEFLEELKKETEERKKGKLENDINQKVGDVFSNIRSQIVSQILKKLLCEIKQVKEHYGEKEILYKRRIKKVQKNVTEIHEEKPKEDLAKPEEKKEEIMPAHTTNKQIESVEKVDVEKNEPKFEKKPEKITSEEDNAWMEDSVSDKELDELFDECEDMDVEDFWDLADEGSADETFGDYEDSPYEDQEDVFGDDFFTKEGSEKYKPSSKKADDFDEVDF